MKIVVRVDRDLSDLIPGFLERKRADAERIIAAADAADYKELGRIGHKIKGEGGSYGFDAITDIGADIERYAKAQDLDAVRGRAQQLRDYLDAVEIEFE